MQLNDTANQVAPCLPERFAGQSLLKNRTLQYALAMMARTYYKKKSICLDPTEGFELH